jgi:RNA polymerase sigma factor (sigma-70 family)
MKDDPTVSVVDDDPDLRRSMQWMLTKSGLNVRTYASAEHYLRDYDPDEPGCVVLDLRMPGMGGIELHTRLRRQKQAPPVIILTGHGDVSTAVRAMEAGATAFIEKPFNRQVLLDRIHSALDQDIEARRRRAQTQQLGSRLDQLTPREREVMQLVVAGKTTKQIALQLGTSDRTIEVHRGHVMKKMGADSLAQLVMLAVRCGLINSK